MLLALVLKKVIHYGQVIIIDAQGRTHKIVGDVSPNLPDVPDWTPPTLRLHNPKLHTSLAVNPTVAFGDAYMDGSLTISEGQLSDMLTLFVYNMARGQHHLIFQIERYTNLALRWWHQNNHLLNSHKNVAHHYDLSRDFYDLFLDEDRQYSCAYYATGTETLEEAQIAKKRHIAAKLLPAPGLSVLDIGCGWGGMGLTLAQDYGMVVDGITLSREQLAVAQDRAAAAGIADKARFHFRDYRHQHGQFDRIVSVGMFEHVGTRFYKTYFRKMSELLKDDGVALIHTIGHNSPPSGTNQWIRKYIFPGGYTPALSEVMQAIEKTRLVCCDVEVLRVHYADTLRDWNRRFQAHRPQVSALYDEKFCRMWEFYLQSCEAAFRYDDLVVFQIQLAKRNNTVPTTRAYLHKAENI